MLSPMTKLEIAKGAVSLTIAAYTAQIVKNQLSQHTAVDPDGLPVKVGTLVAGQLVSAQIRPYTDKMVECVANRIAERRARKQETTPAK